jgi:hypothetical protein
VINIQQFSEYKNFDIKGFFVENITSFCIDKKDVINQLRMIMRMFKFTFRVFYRQVLTEIIKVAKSNLLPLLQAMPELLPHINSYIEEGDEVSMYDGIWRPIG